MQNAGKVLGVKCKWKLKLPLCHAVTCRQLCETRSHDTASIISMYVLTISCKSQALAQENSNRTAIEQQ